MSEPPMDMHTPGASEVLALLCINTYNLYVSTLVGNPCLSTKTLGELIKNPQVGDLVMETSTIYDRARDEHRFGNLLRIEMRPWRESEGPDDVPPLHPFYVIESLAGGEYTWENASFIRVLDVVVDAGGRLEGPSRRGAHSVWHPPIEAPSPGLGAGEEEPRVTPGCAWG